MTGPAEIHYPIVHAKNRRPKMTLCLFFPPRCESSISDYKALWPQASFIYRNNSYIAKSKRDCMNLAGPVYCFRVTEPFSRHHLRCIISCQVFLSVQCGHGYTPMFSNSCRRLRRSAKFSSFMCRCYFGSTSSGTICQFVMVKCVEKVGIVLKSPEI